MTQIAFIGGGNMATSIIGGLIREDAVSPDLIHVSDPGAEQRERLTRDFGIVTHESNLDAISSATVVILAVKPQMMKAVLEPLQATLNTRQPLLISVAAGISLPTLKEWSGCTAVVRAMPNTPALTGFGATGLFASEEVSLDQRNLTDTLLGATGLAMWVQTEAEIDAVTALSGSGPAYYFLLMESMIDAGIKLGLSEETTQRGVARCPEETSTSVSEQRVKIVGYQDKPRIIYASVCSVIITGGVTVGQGTFGVVQQCIHSKETHPLLNVNHLSNCCGILFIYG